MKMELLTPIGLEGAAKCILDPKYGMQEKRDGIRVVAVKSGHHIECWGRQGEPIGTPPQLAKALLAIPHLSFTLDGEFESGPTPHYYVWDLLSLNELDLRTLPYSKRYQTLDIVPYSSFITVLPLYLDTADKERVIHELIAARAEGVVFKKLSAPWREGRNGSHLKFKFTKTCTARVRSVDKDRDAVRVEMLVNGKWAEVCGCKVANGTLKSGQFIEVRYLYGTRDKHLYQPHFLKVREDVSDVDCDFSQVKISKKWMVAA